jgi:hypothetical protein
MCGCMRVPRRHYILKIYANLACYVGILQNPHGVCAQFRKDRSAKIYDLLATHQICGVLSSTGKIETKFNDTLAQNDRVQMI